MDLSDVRKKDALIKEVNLTHPEEEWLPDPDSIQLWNSADTIKFPEIGQALSPSAREREGSPS